MSTTHRYTPVSTTQSAARVLEPTAYPVCALALPHPPPIFVDTSCPDSDCTRGCLTAGPQHPLLDRMNGSSACQESNPSPAVRFRSPFERDSHGHGIIPSRSLTSHPSGVKPIHQTATHTGCRGRGVGRTRMDGSRVGGCCDHVCRVCHDAHRSSGDTTSGCATGWVRGEAVV